ncbi:methyltransferase regulatory domain-containing protein [Mycobacterium hubeiense]|uniref:methyltransferase regulatory domain-containing protein n=1 Tax=Mycobacterium hubeiense TaxID=1867256 RepID=UPI000C7F432B|nr:methyltransferase regulatory domain-containing protein [Mycobacterium sp. QGD 101]
MANAVDQVRAEYDEVPYDSHAFPLSAPGHLAAIAYLFGLDVPDVSSARVLEIGCSAGSNLIPFAAWHAEAHAVGIDLSQVQIDQGRQRVQALGLDNLELLQGDIAEMALEALGQFDYIICHGVYSWVPENVQDAILSAFRRLLVPDGVAYLSYNVYPGWKAKEIVRDAMLLRGGGRGTPDEKLGYARGMIDFLEEVAPADSVLARALADFRIATGNVRDYYLMHEYLETFNSPCYFLEMLERAQEHGLAYLADAVPSTMFAINYGDKVSEPLLKECGHSQVLLEQYLDFVVNQTFRRSLLIHAERAPQIRYRLDRSRYGRLHFAAWLPPVAGETRMDESRQEYGDRDAGTLITHDPGVKAAVEALNDRWPWTLSRDELLTAAQSRLSAAGIGTPSDLDARLDDLLDLLIVRGQLRFRLEPVVPHPSATPTWLDETTRRLAELAREDPDPCVYNAWHEEVALSPLDRHLLPLLDGTRDRNDLVKELLNVAGTDVNALSRDAVTQHVDTIPQRLAGMKLLLP